MEQHTIKTMKFEIWNVAFDEFFGNDSSWNIAVMKIKEDHSKINRHPTVQFFSSESDIELRFIATDYIHSRAVITFQNELIW